MDSQNIIINLISGEIGRNHIMIHGVGVTVLAKWSKCLRGHYNCHGSTIESNTASVDVVLKLIKADLRMIVVHVKLCWVSCTMTSLWIEHYATAKELWNRLKLRMVAHPWLCLLPSCLSWHLCLIKHTMVEHLGSCQPWFMIWNRLITT